MKDDKTQEDKEMTNRDESVDMEKPSVTTEDKPKIEISEKQKEKKSDKTIEKLKSKPPEEIKKEIKKDSRSHIVKNKTLSIIISVILFLFLFGLALAVSYYKNRTPPTETDYRPEAKVELPTEIPEDTDTSDWETYQNNELGVSMKYPSYISVEENENTITLASESINCVTNVSGKSENTSISNFLIEITEHNLINASSYEEAWDDIFSFKFENNYDGEISIANVTGYYFVQGAESLYGKKAILIETPENTFFEINVYTPVLAYDCEEELLNSDDQGEINNRILSTIEFTNSQVQGVTTSSSPCINENEDILSEVLQCEEVTEEICLEHVDQFDYCMSSCLNIVDEDECKDICRPVCETEVSEEL